MNIPAWSDNYIDATNELIISESTSITNANSSNIYTSNNSNLYIDNPNTDGEIRIRVKNNISNPSYDQDYRVRINKDGKLQLYHVYSILTPNYSSGWYDITDEVVGLKFNSDLQQIELTALGATVAVIEGQITDIYATLTTILTALGSVNNSLEFTQDLLYDNQVLNQGHWNIQRTRDNFNQLMEDYVGTSVAGSVRQRVRENYANIANSVSAVTGPIGLGLQIGVPVVSGLVASFYALNEDKNIYNTASNLSNIYFDMTPMQRRQLLDSNLITSVSNVISFASNLSNLSLNQGFINSSNSNQQLIPTIKSNKILLGNITTPNNAYQLEMTGDLNTNMLYINSTSLTSLLNEKQNNMTASAPLYITTANIGLNYDSTLMNNSGSLGLTISSESKWGFTGANIYNKSLTNVGIGTISGISSKLVINGDLYSSSNINCGNRPLTFISSYTNSTLTQVTGTNEYYLQYTTNGTLVLNEPCGCDLFIVGAGGNGGIGASSGGGGAGEVIYYPNFPLRNGTLNVNVGTASTTVANRISSITHSSGTQIQAKGGGNGGSPVFYTTSGGTVSALTTISGTSDAYISITAGTTLTLNFNCTVDVLVVGGGGGASSGGGGAGEVKYLTNQNLNSGSYTITIGAGGDGKLPSSARGDDGNDSFIQLSGSDIIRARKGGGGANNVQIATAPSGIYGSLGGSGHDSGTTYNTFPTGTVLGNVGSRCTNGFNGVGGSYASAGGGGGQGQVGQIGVDGNFYDQNNGALGGAGGNGIQINITGTNTYYGGGGAGGTNINKSTNTQTTRPAGGLGGGGQGSLTDNSGSIGTGLSATANTGGGGGGSDWEATSISGNGGSGIVIIRFKNYLTIGAPASGGSGGGGGKSQTGATAGVKFDDYKSFALSGLSGNSTTGGNGGSGNTTYSRYTTTITGSSLSVALGGTGVGTSPATPTTKTNYGDGGDGNSGVGFQGIVIIRFKVDSNYLQVKSIKDNANSGLILNANESSTAYQLRVFPWSDTFTSTGVATRGWSLRVHDGNNNFDLLNLFSSFGGRVGIKTKNPLATFDVNGDINCKTFFVNGDEQYGILCQIANAHALGESAIVLIGGSSGSYGSCSIVYNPADSQGIINCSRNLIIKTQRTDSYIYINDTSGNVGIGLTNPSTKLQVNGTITATNVEVTTGLNVTTLSAGQAYITGTDTNLLNNMDGTITNNKYFYSSNIYVNNFIDMQNKIIYNCSYLYGGASYANEWKATTNLYHKDDQNRDRIYFKHDTSVGVTDHFTLFKSGSYSHIFADKDDTQYAILDRFGFETYFPVTTLTTDYLAVVEPNASGTWQYRKAMIKYGSFTEFHRVFIDDELYLNYDDFMDKYIGRVVVSTGKIKRALKKPNDTPWEVLENKEAISIDDAQPIVQLSRKKKSKEVYGVITYRKIPDFDGRICVNGLGEGGIWIVNTNGNLENGNYLQSSNEIGYAERQDDDLLHNYTIGKVVMDCDFQLDSPYYKCEDLGNGLRRAFVGCVYYCG